VMFYLLSDDGKDMVYLSADFSGGKMSADTKTILLVADKSLESVNSQDVYALYVPPDVPVAFHVDIPHSQF